MRYIKPEKRPDLTWMIEHWTTPLADLADSASGWISHTARHIRDGKPAQAKSTLWQISDSADVLYSRLSDMDSQAPWIDERGRELPGMTKRQLEALYLPVFADYLKSEFDKECMRWESAGVAADKLNEIIVSLGGPDMHDPTTELDYLRMCVSMPGMLNEYDLSDPNNPKNRYAS